MVKFNEQQLEAVKFGRGAATIIAGAGSGKSTVLVGRVKWLVKKGVKPSSILLITFTSKAAAELKTRLEKNGVKGIVVGTFHAICMRILYAEGYDLKNKLVPIWQVESWMREIIPQGKIETDSIVNWISYQKLYQIPPNANEKLFKMNLDIPYDLATLRRMYRHYEKRKEESGKYDFTDYLVLALEVLERGNGEYSFPFVMVDEHQDTNLLQNKILDYLAAKGNIVTVGDPRQSIYSFQAANIEHFLEFSNKWKNTKVINLDINYRSRRNIVLKANDFIRPYFKHYEHYSDAVPFSEEDGDIKLISEDTAESVAREVALRVKKLIDSGVKPKDIAVLYRLNSQSAHLELELINHKIEYDIQNDSSFFKRKEIAVVLGILRLILDLNDDEAMAAIFKARVSDFKFFSSALIQSIKNKAKSSGRSVAATTMSYSYPKQFQRDGANSFKRAMSLLRRINKENGGKHLTQLIDLIVQQFNLKAHIEEISKNEEEKETRMRSLEIIKTFVKSNNLEQFISFVYNEGMMKRKSNNKNLLKLMTAHASKGLEWKHVFLIGLEEDKFPHALCDEEEEARLFYVASTRAIETYTVCEVGERMYSKAYLGDSYDEELKRYKKEKISKEG